MWREARANKIATKRHRNTTPQREMERKGKKAQSTSGKSTGGEKQAEITPTHKQGFQDCAKSNDTQVRLNSHLYRA